MTKPEFRVFSSREDVAAAVARYLADKLAANPQATLGLATGKTFISIYAEVVKLFNAKQMSFAEAASFNLDEYVGLPAGHPASFRSYMEEHLFRHVDIPAADAHLPAVEGDVGQSCAAYEAAIAARGGIDLQLLGIGQNGHIGFNEPGSAFDSRTRQVELSQSTIEANTSDFPAGELPPPSAVTMGVGTITEAKEIVLVALGANKTEALKAAFDAEPSLDCPASALQSHPKVIVFCDMDAKGDILG
jgi:glucosamine-6-phosphate deaminase